MSLRKVNSPYSNPKKRLIARSNISFDNGFLKFVESLIEQKSASNQIAQEEDDRQSKRRLSSCERNGKNCLIE